MKKGFFELSGAVATLVGTIIGAGVLAIPYVIMRAGFLTGLLNLIVLSIAVIFLYLYLGEVVLRTRKKYQLTGYSQKYLGSTGRKLMTFSMVFGIYGALIAYLIGVGKSLAAIFSLQNTYFVMFGISLSFDVIFSLLFFILGSAIVYLGIEGVKKSELFMSSIVMFIIILISIISLSGFNAQNVLSFNLSNIFLPYGVILFALAGAVAIPEMQEELKDKKKLKNAVIIGTLIPIFFYFLFSLATVGACGKATSEIAVTCLAQKFGVMMLWLGNLFAIFAMSTSFLALGLGLKEMYNYDYKIKEKKAWSLACVVPLILFFLIFLFVKQERFFKTIDITGGIAMTLEGILIVLMFNKAKKLGEREPEYSIKQNRLISIALISIFLFGMVYTLLHFFGLL